MRNGYIPYLHTDPGDYWFSARIRNDRRAWEVLNFPENNELWELAATQVAHGTYAYRQKWDEYQQYVTDAVLNTGDQVPPLPWPLFSLDNFLINWVANGHVASLPAWLTDNNSTSFLREMDLERRPELEDPTEIEKKIVDRWRYLADRPYHMAYILPGLNEIFSVESDCPCGSLFPYVDTAPSAPRITVTWPQAYYMPAPLKQFQGTSNPGY